MMKQKIYNLLLYISISVWFASIFGVLAVMVVTPPLADEKEYSRLLSKIEKIKANKNIEELRANKNPTILELDQLQNEISADKERTRLVGTVRNICILSLSISTMCFAILKKLINNEKKTRKSKDDIPKE